MDFASAERMFKQDRLRELADSPIGLRYLKLRSLSRKEHMQSLLTSKGIQIPTSAKAMLRIAFDSNVLTEPVIDKAIKSIYATERATRLSREPALVSELYKMHSFDWGGLHQNSLEKTIVDSYVKKITDFDALNARIDNELLASMRGYVLCSWYNHWTSIIIEDVFRDHPSVLPAVGQIKKIDFFVKQVPFDLKVTYLPEGFLKDCRKSDSLRPELTLLKQAARSVELRFDSAMSDAQLLEDLWNKIADHPQPSSQALIADLRRFRLKVLDQCQSDPSDLIRWLYENQGVRRFDASNRLFLVLVDKSNFFASWRLKRAKPLLDAKIRAYLDSLTPSPGRRLKFTWEGKEYTVVSDVVFIVHSAAS